MVGLIDIDAEWLKSMAHECVNLRRIINFQVMKISIFFGILMIESSNYKMLNFTDVGLNGERPLLTKFRNTADDVKIPLS
jgi:hypothetical protein